MEADGGGRERKRERERERERARESEGEGERGRQVSAPPPPPPNKVPCIEDVRVQHRGLRVESLGLRASGGSHLADPPLGSSGLSARV